MVECYKKGLRIAKIKDNSTLMLCFAGIATEKIENGVNLLNIILKNM